MIGVGSLAGLFARPIVGKILAGASAVLLLVACFCFWQWQDTRGDWFESQDALRRERLAHRITAANFRIATAEARIADRENAARVEAEHSDISERISDDYEARLADARARAERLRDELRARGSAPADTGGGRTAPVPGLSDAAGGADGAACDIGLSVAERLTATETAIRLEALQEWARGVAAIDVNGEQDEAADDARDAR